MHYYLMGAEIVDDYSSNDVIMNVSPAGELLKLERVERT